MSSWVDVLDSKNHTYDNTTSGLTADTTKKAIDEIAGKNITSDFLLDGYKEQGVILGPTGNYQINLDGKLYEFSETLTGNITLTVGTKPTAPECSSAVIYVKPDGNTVTINGITYWSGGAIPKLDTLMRYVLSTTVTGDVIADGEAFK
jgi:hypothetical protein